MNVYVPLCEIRNELMKHYEKYKKCCSIPFVCQKLLNRPELLVNEYYNPFPPEMELLNDEEFMKLFFQSLYPLTKTMNAIENNDPNSHLSETLFSKTNLFMVFLHENFAKQGIHKHNHFEITYVFKGTCTMVFEKSTLKMLEGNICIVAPNTLHEPIVCDKDSFVISLSMTVEAFKAAFSVVLLRKDLIASYIQTILFRADMQNYLFIPSCNTVSMKNAVKQISYAARCDHAFSYSICISWLSIFITSVFCNYQTDIQLYNDSKQHSHGEYLILLEYIQNNFQTATLDSVAKALNYNKSYLSRLILQITGKSFIQNITESKLNAGKNLLENTDYTTEQIAELIGYSSGDYFSKVLKKVCHISAAEYRKKSRNHSENTLTDIF